MNMPKTVYLAIDNDDVENLDPASLPDAEWLPDEHYFRAVQTPESTAQLNSVVRIAEYRFVRMIEVKNETAAIPEA